MAEIIFKGKTYKVNDFVGVVAEASKQRETNVEGSGGGTSDIRRGIDDIKISTKTTVIDYFYLVNDDGVERNFKVENCDLAIRKGHRVQVIGIDNDPCVVVNNMTLNQVNWTGNSFDERMGFIYVVIFIVGLIIISAISLRFQSIILWAILFLILLFYLLIKFGLKASAFKQELQPFIMQPDS